MCQLTLVNFGNKNLTRLALYYALYINSDKHKDGYGYFQPGLGIIKGKEQARELYGNFIPYRFEDNIPVIGHVRQASWVKNVKLPIDVKFSHPFESEHYILAHNGTLTLLEDEVFDKDSLENFSDSYQFLVKLEKESQDIPFVERFNNAYDQFYGQFAFLIYEKLTGKYYVIRGRNKKLHIAKFFMGSKRKLIGFAVNTELESFRTWMERFETLASVTYNVTIYHDAPTELAEETIYEVEDFGLKEIGKAKENFPPVSSKSSFEGVIVKSTDEKLLDFMCDMKLNIHELDFLINYLFGKSLVEVEYKEVEALYSIKAKLNAYRIMGNDKLWDDVIHWGYSKKNELYRDGSVLFPAFMDKDLAYFIQWNPKDEDNLN